MLGPGIMVAGIPFSVGYSSYAVQRMPHLKSARIAQVVSVAEAVLLITLLLLAVVLG